MGKKIADAAVVERDERLVGVVAQADVAQEARPKKVGEMVEEISG